MIDISGLTSAQAVARAYEEESRTQQRIESEKAAANTLKFYLQSKEQEGFDPLT